MNENIEQILKLNLTDEQKEALLGQLANEIIEKNQVEKDSFETKKEELKAKQRQKAEATKKRLVEYKERSLKEENQRKRDEELEDKIKALSEITNQQGEKIYSDLSDLSGYEIDQLYDIYIEKNREPNESDQVNSNNEEKANVEKVNSNDKKMRELTLEEANKVLDLANRVGPLTEEEQNFIFNLISETGVENQDELVNNAKSLVGISEKNDNSIEKNDNYRDLTLEEAKKLVEYENKLIDGTITEEEKIALKPIIDDLMEKTGIDNIQSLFDRAQEIVDSNVKIEDSTEKQADFLSKSDVNELNNQEKSFVRNKLGLDENAEITKEDLSDAQAGLVANNKKDEGRKPVKKISETTEKLKTKIKEKFSGKAKGIAKAVGAVVLVGTVIATGAFGLFPSLATLAAGGLGVKAVQEFNKGKKL